MPGEVPKKKQQQHGQSRPTTTTTKTKKVTTSKLIGTPEQRALNRQWVEYNLSYLKKTPSHSQNILRELDYALLPFSFFTGNSLAVADNEIYDSLFATYSSMTFQDKEKYVNLSRWFRLIQEDDKVRGDRDKLPFSRMPLYS